MAKKNHVVLKNSFHNTQIMVRKRSAGLLAEYRSDLSRNDRRTVDRIRAKLCGSRSCTCGVVR